MRRPVRRQRAQGLREGMRGHDHEHHVGGADRGGKVGRGAQAVGQGDPGQVAVVLVLAIDRGDRVGITAPQRSCCGRGARSTQPARCPRSPRPAPPRTGARVIGSGVAGSLGIGQSAAGGLLRGALAQAFGVQRLEVDRLQEERREAAGLDQVADGLARIRDTARSGNACRAWRRAWLRRSRPGRTRRPAALPPRRSILSSSTVQVRVMPSTTSNALSLRRWTRWLRFICSCGWACSLNTCGRLGRLERHVLDVDLLDAELRAGGLCGGGGAVEGLVGHRITPAKRRKKRVIIARGS